MKRVIIVDVRFPIGELELPEKVTMNDINQWLDEIGNYANRLRKVVDGLNDEALKKKHREGSWTVRQLVHHIADSQLNMYQRLKIALTDDRKRTIVGFDQKNGLNYQIMNYLSNVLLEC